MRTNPVTVIDIEKETKENDFYRHIIYTSEFMQLAYMCLYPGEKIELEEHDADQFIRIEDGSATVIIDEKKYLVSDGMAIIVPAHHKHYIENSGNDKVKLYTIYSPPTHHHFDNI